MQVLLDIFQTFSKHKFNITLDNEIDTLHQNVLYIYL